MAISMYQAGVPVVLRTLNALMSILGKAEEFCTARKIDPTILLQARLYPDMFPLVRQVQIACDLTKGMAARLAGMDVPSYEDTEATMAELKARIQKTVAFVQSVPSGNIDGSEGRDITLRAGANEMKFKGQDYLIGFVLPNVYFHVTTAYAILRHNGVEIGKKDFLAM